MVPASKSHARWLYSTQDHVSPRPSAGLGLTVTQAARGLDVSRKTLSAILNSRAGISPEMAVRLSLAFGTSAESWMNQQTQYDLWHVERRRKKLHVARLSAA